MSPGAPHEPRPHDDRLEAVAVGVAHGLLGHRLGRRSRAPSSRAAAARPRSRSRAARPASSAASVPTCTKRRTPAARAASSALRVPPTLLALELLARAPLAEVGGGVEGVRRRPSAPARIASRVVEVAAHRLGAERATPSPPTRPSARARAPPPVADQALDQPAADEAGAAGDERGAAASLTRASPCRAARRPVVAARSPTPTSTTNAVSRPARPGQAAAAARRAQVYPSSPRRLPAPQHPTMPVNDQGHRAPRLTRAPRRRGAERGDRVAPRSAPPRQLGRELQHPRLPQGQGAGRRW